MQEAIQDVTVAKFMELIQAWLELALSSSITDITLSGVERSIHQIGNQCVVSAHTTAT